MSVASRWLAVAAVTATLAPINAAGAPAPVTQVPIDQYPVAQPQPLGQSRPPVYLDEDETVRARLASNGSVTAITDDVILRIRGSGDYVVLLPGRATQVANLGGDLPPGLQEGHVSFLGNLIGQGQLGAEATLEQSAARTLPLAVRIGYSAGGRPVEAAHLASQRGPVTVRVEVVNLTGVARQFVRGNPPASALAPVLENLRQVPAAYTPETDLSALLPMPTALPVTGPLPTETHDVFVPLSIGVTVKLAPGETVLEKGAGDLTPDARGARLGWSQRLPAAPDEAGAEVLSFTYAANHPRLPSIEIKADPLPLPATLFTPPGGGTWAAYLSRTADRSAAAVLAQQGAASLHRIQDLVLPLNRPGPGPQKVKYDLVLDSGSIPISAPHPSAPVHPQAWALVLVSALASFAAANAVSAWVRH